MATLERSRQLGSSTLSAISASDIMLSKLYAIGCIYVGQAAQSRHPIRHTLMLPAPRAKMLLSSMSGFVRRFPPCRIAR
jgi:hypothetical protein